MRLKEVRAGDPFRDLVQRTAYETVTGLQAPVE